MSYSTWSVISSSNAVSPARWLRYWSQRMMQHWEFSGIAEHPLNIIVVKRKVLDLTPTERPLLSAQANQVEATDKPYTE